jgi:hypothetical protein
MNICPSGHELTEENTHIDQKTGRKRCRRCRGEYSKKYYHANKEKIKAYYKKWDENNKDRRLANARKATLKSVYGITEADYEAMQEAQNNLCAICNKPQSELRNKYVGSPTKRLDIDHCHKTNIVRGLLCRRCNTGIGLFFESPELLNKAVEYLVATHRTVINKSQDLSE